MFASTKGVLGGTRRAAAAVAGRALVRRLRGPAGIALSVVIVAHAKTSYLELALAALERQAVPKEAWEVIVVGGAPGGETAALLDRYEKRGQLPLVPRDGTACRGSAALHNACLERARGRIIVFLHDVAIATGDFVLRHLRRHPKEPCVVVGDNRSGIHTHLFCVDQPALEGASPIPLLQPEHLNAPQQLRGLLFERGSDYRPLLAHFHRCGTANPFPWLYFDAGNASVPREYLVRVGGFDEGFDGWGLGDWGLADKELAYRLYRAGLPFYFQPRACALRQLHPEDPAPLRERIHNLCYFFSKHPELDRARLEPILLGGGAPLGAGV